MRSSAPRRRRSPLGTRRRRRPETRGSSPAHRWRRRDSRSTTYHDNEYFFRTVAERLAADGGDRRDRRAHRRPDGCDRLYRRPVRTRPARGPERRTRPTDRCPSVRSRVQQRPGGPVRGGRDAARRRPRGCRRAGRRRRRQPVAGGTRRHVDRRPTDRDHQRHIRQARQTIQNLSRPFREQITGVAPQSGPWSGDDDLGFFVAHAIDCTYLLALAAIQADSDNALDLRRTLPAVSTGGRFCTVFAVCLETLADGLGVDYNGRSGRVDLSIGHRRPDAGLVRDVPVRRRRQRGSRRLDRDRRLTYRVSRLRRLRRGRPGSRRRTHRTRRRSPSPCRTAACTRRP